LYYIVVKEFHAMLVRQKITSEREKNGLTTRELALRLNINRGTVSRWENGYIKTIPLDMLQKIAEIFNIKSKFALRW
jgi:transcriptional regulator with XRE-family HTH domain